MIRHSRLFGAALVGVALVLLGRPLVPATPSVSAAGRRSKVSSSGKPNMVVILTDDMDAASLKYMPKVQRLLATEGTTFTQFFNSHSLCCPSRASFLRGRYEHNHKIFSNVMPDGGFRKFHDSGVELSTIGTWLQGANYNTGYIGKYLNGYATRRGNTYEPPGWNEWDVLADRGDDTDLTHDAAFNYTLNENRHLVKHGSAAADYLTDVLAQKSDDFIQRQSPDKPFLLYLAPHAPHSPATPAPRHANLFASAIAPRTPSFNEADVSDKPPDIRNTRLLSTADIAAIDDLYRKRLQSLQSVDDMVGSVVLTLQARGQLDNTYIVFTTDNGFHQGQHRLKSSKNEIYEQDLLLPFVVRGPGVTKGKVVNELAGNVDLAPTVADIAQITAPNYVDGRSLTPLWGSSPVPAWRQAFLLEKHPGSSGGSIGVRTKDYTYIEYPDGFRELYDLHRDPDELQNIYATADPALLRSLSSRVKSLSSCQGSGCRTSEQ